MEKHIPVLLESSLEALNIQSDGIYVDLTLGRAGHSKEILKRLTTGHLYCFDKDAQAIEQSQQILQTISPNFTIIHSDFKFISRELAKLGVTKVDGILADLGASSPQFDDPSRGFSFSKDGKLDMRMDQAQDLDADKIVNTFSEETLTEILQKNADVKLARQVAKAICKNRPIKSTLQLADVVKNSYPAALLRQKNPNRSVFQALRIAVNDEFNSLRTMLNQIPELLKRNGVLAVITFHSIEDRIVKQFFNSLKVNPETYKLPLMINETYKFKKISVTENEKIQNYRARSASLRTLTKLTD